jgi:hypothetical protein
MSMSDSDTTTVIKIGDIVTWRQGDRATLKFMPLRITGCKVRELFDVQGKAVAEIDCGRMFGRVNAWVADLELEDKP